jgi:hypothetical protein
MFITNNVCETIQEGFDIIKKQRGLDINEIKNAFLSYCPKLPDQSLYSGVLQHSVFKNGDDMQLGKIWLSCLEEPKQNIVLRDTDDDEFELAKNEDSTFKTLGFLEI